MIKAEIEGVEEFNKFLGKMAKENEIELDKLLALAANETRNNAVRSIQTSPASGRTYVRRGVSHIASSPGNPPRTDTGNLVSNITVNKITKMAYTVGSRLGAPYGFWLEFGTRNIQKRPWLQPAFDATVRKFESKFNG